MYTEVKNMPNFEETPIQHNINTPKIVNEKTASKFWNNQNCAYSCEQKHVSVSDTSGY